MSRLAGLANENGSGSVLQAVLETATGLSMRLNERALMQLAAPSGSGVP